MNKLLRVALLVEWSGGFGRKLLQGIAGYSKEHGPWIFRHEQRALDDPIPRGLAAWKPDGIIARIPAPSFASQLHRLSVPMVYQYHQDLLEGASRFALNNEANIRMAVEHLQECGFQNFAYVGFPNVMFSEVRAEWFIKLVAAKGFTPHLYGHSSGGKAAPLGVAESTALRHEDTLVKWLQRLPKPVGLVACSDVRAQQVLTVCSEYGISVPDTIAVIGEDNDEVTCDMTWPTLSSVDPNAYRMGYEAASLLHRMIVGKEPVPPTTIIDPIGVVARRSTETVIFKDPEVCDVVRYIRDHACEGLTVQDVVRHANVSRATLDRQLMKHLGRSPRAEIARVQVQRARELLAGTDLQPKKIARRTGFRHVETMYRAIRKETGQTPVEYRQATKRVPER